MFVVDAAAGQDLCPRSSPYPQAVEQFQSLPQLGGMLDAGEDAAQDAAVLDGLVGALPAKGKHLDQG